MGTKNALGSIWNHMLLLLVFPFLSRNGWTRSTSDLRLTSADSPKPLRGHRLGGGQHGLGELRGAERESDPRVGQEPGRAWIRFQDRHIHTQAMNLYGIGKNYLGVYGIVTYIGGSVNVCNYSEFGTCDMGGTPIVP